MKEPEERDVYISYHDNDSDWVSTFLIPELKTLGLTIYTPEDFIVGLPELDNRRLHIKKCRRVILVITPDWKNGSWEAFDLSAGVSTDPAGKKAILFPLIYKECDVPNAIDRLTCFDISNKTTKAKIVSRLKQLKPVEQAFIQPSSEHLKTPERQSDGIIEQIDKEIKEAKSEEVLESILKKINNKLEEDKR